jgi:hypothetical protein
MRQLRRVCQQWGIPLPQGNRVMLDKSKWTYRVRTPYPNWAMWFCFWPLALLVTVQTAWIRWQLWRRDL